MDFFSSWHKLHISIRGFLIGIIGIAPFWYLLIALFAGDWFINYPIHLQVIIPYCLTILMYSLCLWATTFFDKPNFEADRPYFFSFFVCILILSYSIKYLVWDDHVFLRTRDLVLRVFYIEFWALFGLGFLINIVRYGKKIGDVFKTATDRVFNKIMVGKDNEQQKKE